MSELVELILPPSEDGYSAEESVETVIRTQLDGGAGRYRKDIFGASDLVSCQWICDAGQYNYLRSFYRSTDSGSLPFKAKLIIDHADLQYYECRFIPKSFKLDGVKGLSYSVSATIEATPINEIDVDLDKDIIFLAELLGPDYEQLFIQFSDKLDKIVNIDWPLVWRSWNLYPKDADDILLESIFGNTFKYDFQVVDSKLDQYVNFDYPLIFGNMRKGLLSEIDQTLLDNMGPEYYYYTMNSMPVLENVVNKVYPKVFKQWTRNI